ncbi:unnamed protein product [Onchocerca flexuosa]|uniref:Uncharacterized protein n=1 Tax=Onchocerca flexuosa TaxID=387005 RepID=A0A183HRZ8_9BILA|nr:unnamed protein product [Onchocerca flexuosa]
MAKEKTEEGHRGHKNQYIIKISAESNDAKEKQAEEGCINDPPPSYEVNFIFHFFSN